MSHRHPDDLERELARLLTAAPPAVEVPPAQDRALRAAARERAAAIAAPRRRRRRLWLATGALACAAAVALLLSVRGFGAGDQMARSSVAVGDVNRDGVVDVIDALVLSRSLESGAAPAAELDVDGDGSVDGGDVDWIARRAVAVERSAR